jgi:hypothetical protein
VTAGSWKLLAAVLLTLGIGVQILEASGRWDQNFQDANDEAAIVAIVLCVGVAVATAATLRLRLRMTRGPSHVLRDTRRRGGPSGTRLSVLCHSASPPATLRI